MKIFDCFMYFDEDLVLDVRLNLLNDFVDKFVIIESKYDHKGKKREPLFDIKKFKKFEKKITYILKDDQPGNLEKIYDNDDEKEHYRKSIFNASKRESSQRNYILNGLKDAKPQDWIIISDLDEIPNLKKINFKNVDNKFLFFKQDMMYYKFNLKLDNFFWMGTKACKYRYLKSPQWLRDIKSKKFGWIHEKLAMNYFASYGEKKWTTSAIKKAQTHYRQLVSSINKYLGTVQINQCQHNWKSIDFNTVTSITMIKQKRYKKIDKYT